MKETGLILVFGSWLWIMAAVLTAKFMYRTLQKTNALPYGFEARPLGSAFRTAETKEILEIVKSGHPNLMNLPPRSAKLVVATRFMYWSSPLAFILFIVGVIISGRRA